MMSSIAAFSQVMKIPLLVLFIGCLVLRRIIKPLMLRRFDPEYATVTCRELDALSDETRFSLYVNGLWNLIRFKDDRVTINDLHRYPLWPWKIIAAIYFAMIISVGCLGLTVSVPYLIERLEIRDLNLGTYKNDEVRGGGLPGLVVDYTLDELKLFIHEPGLYLIRHAWFIAFAVTTVYYRRRQKLRQRPPIDSGRLLP